MNRPINFAWPIVGTYLIIMAWMPYEGLLWLVMIVGILLTLLWGWMFFRQTPLLSGLGPVGRPAAFGALLGLVAPILILGLMILKTGVHAHGPEYSPLEIRWITQQIAIWPFVGSLAGFGISFLGRSFANTSE